MCDHQPTFFIFGNIYHMSSIKMQAFNNNASPLSFQKACQENMALDVKKYLKSIGIFSTVCKRPSIHILQVARWDDLHKLYFLLYKNTSIFLKRKREKFEQLLNSRIT